MTDTIVRSVLSSLVIIYFITLTGKIMIVIYNWYFLWLTKHISCMKLFRGNNTSCMAGLDVWYNIIRILNKCFINLGLCYNIMNLIPS